MSTFVISCFKFAFPIAHEILLFIAKNIILYLSNITIPINITSIPNCSFQVNYTLLDDKVIIDKLHVYNKKIHVKPFSIPIFNSETKGIHINTKSGFISINNLNIYDIKNSLINIEINNINLYELLKDNNCKNSYINGKALLKINGNEIKCNIKDFIIKNIKVDDINIGNLYLNGNYEQTDTLKNMQCNIDKLTINNIKVNDNSLNNLHLIGNFNSNDIKKDINCNIKVLDINKLLFNNNSLESLHLVGNCKSNDIKNNIKCNIIDLNVNNLKLYNNSLGNLQFNGNCESTDIKNNIKCKINQLLANKIKFNKNIVDSLYINGYYNSNNFKQNIDCNIKDLNIKNIKLDDKSAESIHLTGSCISEDIKKNIQCNIEKLNISNIKVNGNSAEKINIIGTCNSSDFTKDMKCNINNLYVSNLKLFNNSTSKLNFSGIFNSSNISKYIDCSINNLNCNNLKLKDINIGDVKVYGEYKNNNINCKLDLQSLKHCLLCNGKLILGENPKLDLLLKSSNSLILNNLKINNDLNISTNCQYNTKIYHYKNNNTVDLDIKTSNNIFKGINLGSILLKGNYNNNKLHCKLDLNKWKHIINCNGTLKIDPKLYYNLNITNNGPLVLNNLEVAKNLPININSNYNFNINNNNNKFCIKGNLKLNNCSISQYLNNINANINLNNNVLNINNLSANIPSFIRGKLNVNGNINLDSNNNTNCSIKLINGIITNIPVIKGTVEANLKLTGDIIKNPVLNGDIIIRNPKADLTPVLSGAMLSTQIIEKFVNKKPKNENNNKVILSPINTNINVKIDKILEANGPGLETTWKGGANIQCTKGKPLNWNAKLNLIKGKYTIANKKLKLTSGECIANPNIKGLFTLMLAGKKKSNNDVVELKFVQKQNNTQIEFFSQPMKSKQDILALLLFDKYSSELSSSESYSLAMTIQSLTSGKGSIFSKVQDTLRIDSIELKDNTDKSGDAYKSISIGKKIGKWKVNLERGKDNSSFKGSIERKLFKNTKVSVGASKDSGAEVGLIWSKRY